MLSGVAVRQREAEAGAEPARKLSVEPLTVGVASDARRLDRKYGRFNTRKAQGWEQ